MSIKPSKSGVRPRKNTVHSTRSLKSAETKRRERLAKARERVEELPKTYGEYTTLSIDELRVGEYQRPLNELWVQRIVERYDPSLFQPLTVALRENDNQYYVVDGQHRLEAARTLGIKRVPCVLFMETDVQHEAKQFVGLQEARIALPPAQKYHAKLMANDEETMAIQAILEKHGYAVVNRAFYTQQRDNQFSATGMLYTIYRMSEPNGALLDEALSILREAWNGERDSLTASCTRGLAAFLKRYGDHAYYSRKDFVERLRSYQPRDITTRTTAISASLGCSYASAAGQTFLELYNQRRHLRRLPGAILEG